jgi:hypothetical protein
LTKSKLAGLHSKHAEELEGLRDHFHKFRAAQQEVVSALENQLTELRRGDNDTDDFSDLAADNTYVSYGQEFGSNTSVQEAQERMQKLAQRHRLKRLELNAILKAISNAGASVSSDANSISMPSMSDRAPLESMLQALANTSSGVAPDRGETANTFDAYQSKRPLREELLEARIGVSDQELEGLRVLLDKERKLSASLRAQLGSSGDGTMQGKGNETHHIAQLHSEGEYGAVEEVDTDLVPPAGSDKKFSSFVRRVNNMRKSNLLLISKLREEIKAMRDDPVRDENKRFKSQLSELKTEMVALREENARKTKLLSSFKSTRAADTNAVEQWRHEAEELEEKLKRMKSTLVSKDTLIRDLKAKIETIESAANEVGLGDGDATGGDYGSMSANELKNR